MRCEEIMRRSVECCFPWEDVSIAAGRMRFRGIGFLPVIDDSGAVVGTITDRDLTIRVLADALPARETTVGAVMSRGLVFVHPWEDVSTAEARMMAHRKSRIVVVDGYGRPVGIISLSNIAQREWVWRSGRVLRAISAREARA